MDENGDETEGKRVPMPASPRAVIHLDLDAFFAAVEVLENPALAGKAAIVGGSPEGRGVVLSASYPARAFGVHSGMPTYRALALCPQAIVVPPRHRLYWSYSRRVMAIVAEAAELVQQMSIDEACLELTDRIDAWDDAVEAAFRLQQRVREEVGLSASLGVATNKLLAKIASDRDKPGGLTVVRPGEETAFLAPLPVSALWGIGPVTAQRLAALGVTTVGQLAQTPAETLSPAFGRQAPSMIRRAQGIDHRPVVAEHKAHSMSRERTFDRDLADPEALGQHLLKLSQGVAQRLRRAGLSAGTVALKIRYADFSTFSRQTSLSVPTDDEQVIYQAALTLFRRAWTRRAVRLLGVGAHHLCQPVGQLPLW
jgi:DNA polymerase IV